MYCAAAESARTAQFGPIDGGGAIEASILLRRNAGAGG